MQKIKNKYNFIETVQALSASLHENGFIRSIVYILPNLTTAVSGVLTIKDEDGNTIYTSGAINENASTLVDSLSIPIDDNYVATFTLNAASGATNTVTINMYVEEI